MAASLVKIRIFANIYSYTGDAHKSVKDDHTVFVNNPEYAGATFNYTLRSGMAQDIYVMICGRATTSQRDIIRIMSKN